MHAQTAPQTLQIDDFDGAVAQCLLEDSTDCVKILDPQGRIRFMNPGGLCAMELDDYQQVHGQVWWTMWPEESRTLLEAAVGSAVRGGFAEIEAPCPTAKGNPRWWRVRFTTVESRKYGHMVVVSSRDITDERDNRRDIQLHRAQAAVLTRTARVVTEDLHRHLTSEFAAAEGSERPWDKGLRDRVGRANSVFALLGRALADADRDRVLPHARERLVAELRLLADAYEEEMGS